VVEAVEDCIHVEQVLSIDEMWAWLPFNRRDPETVESIGRKIKATVTREISPFIKVSVGAAPNKYLAKMASKMRKPDGLFIIENKNLPQVLYELKLRDLTGIARRTEARLHAAGIHSVEALCHAPKHLLHGVWGGVLGDRLWHLLRGDEIPELVSARKSIGHSHVLPPEHRHPDKAWPILCKLLHKACERLRSHGLLCGALTMQLAYLRGPAWSPEIRMPETDSTLRLMHLLDRLWRERPDPREKILHVGVMLTRLVTHDNHTPELFQSFVAESMESTEEKPDEKLRRLDTTLDQLRARYGRSVVYFGGVQESRDTAPMRISFTHIPDIRVEM
jgi:DNA polymerase-4